MADPTWRDIEWKPGTRIGLPQVWLTTCVKMLEPWFVKRDYPIPDKLRVSLGSRNSRTLHGIAYFKPTADGFQNIFIQASIDDPIVVGGVLVHELIHCILPPGTGHKKPFKDAATALGLIGPMRSTNAGPELTQHLTRIATALGPYPHKALRLGPQPRDPEPQKHYRAVCAGCHSVVTMMAKTYARGVIVTCTNEECDECGTDMEIEPFDPTEIKKRKKRGQMKPKKVPRYTS